MGKKQIVKALGELYQTPLPLKLKDKLLRAKCKKTAKIEVRFLNKTKGIENEGRAEDADSDSKG